MTMEREEIEHLVEEIKRGSLEKYGVIIERFQQSLYIYCCHMLGDPQEAEDALQEVLFKVYQNISQYTYSLSFSAWLYRIAYHHCVNLLKRKKLQKLFPFLYHGEHEARNNVEEKIDREYLSEPLQKALSRLSAQERHIVILRVLEERDYEEIAQLLQIKATTLRKKYERALKKCKQHFVWAGGIVDETRRASDEGTV